MDHTDYPFEFDEWLRKTREKMRVAADFVGDRGYRHFDGRLSHQKLDSGDTLLVNSLKDPHLLAKYSFMPFIRNDKKVRRYTKNSIGQKVRPIMYASHADACVFAFYSYLLKKTYEEKIKGTPIAESVLAYRHIPRSAETSQGKCNIDFAAEIRDLTRKHPQCAIICLDISKFFDNMDHTLIKKRWARLLGVDELPIGHYTVYRNITNYRYVMLRDALTKLGLGRYRDGKFIYHIDAPRTGPLCTYKEFREKIDGKQNSVVRKHTKPRGIPQGSPISDIIANMYLEEFDRDVLDKLGDYSFGYYRRYSDDILLICPIDQAKNIYDFVMDRIKDELLVIKAEKTEAVTFDNSMQEVSDITYQVTGLDKHEDYKRQSFQYLGFDIDAKDIHVRSGTVAAHYRRAKRRAKAEAARGANPGVVQKKSRNKSKRSRWQYFINSKRRTGSERIGRQLHKILRRVALFNAGDAAD